MKASLSAYSSMSFEVGFPAPWPDLMSILINTGASPACAAWSAAVNLKLWAGNTRSSWSPIVIRVHGYSVPGLILW